MSPRNKGRRFGSLAAWSLTLLLGLFACATFAAQERYDYDGLGRLVRVIDEQGRVTEYVYDAAGNILQVIAGTGGVQAPAITAISPNLIRRGEIKSMQIIGTGLIGAQVGISDPGLGIANVAASSTLVSFTLTATASAVLGPQQVTVSNAAGSATTSLTVSPVLPKLGMSPLPIAVPPTGASRNFFVSLSSADNIDHVVGVASANTAIATVSPASVTIAAGQTEAIVSIAGQSAGTTAINLTSSTLAGTAVPVFVTSEFTGLTTSFTRPLGVVLDAPPGGTSTTFGPFTSPLVGVAVGAYLGGVTPRTLAIGTGPTPLVITGAGLEGVTAVAIQPADGLTLGTISVAPDGRSVTVPVTVAANALTTVRKVVLTGAQQPYIPAQPSADQIQIMPPGPEIFSIDPIFAVTGTTGATLTVRGRNLQDAQSVNFTPGTGISVSATPVANADGSILTVSFSVSPLAVPAEHVVSVATTGGASSATPSSANTFRVVNEVQAVYTPIASAHLGVLKQDATPPSGQTLNAFSGLLGVALGPVITGRTPQAGIIGETVQLAFSGNALQGVTAVEFLPADGLTVGAPSVGADGRSVTVSVTIAATAAQTLRALRVRAGTAVIPFSDPSAAQFRITAPLPLIDSTTPIVYQIGGGNVMMTVRGVNLQGAQLVRLIPPDGVSITAPVVNAAGTELTATVNVSAAAAAGSRIVIITTPAGESSSSGNAANTVQLVTTISVTSIVSPDLGVVLETTAPPPALSIGPVVAPALGVLLQESNPPPPQEMVRALQVGVALGPFASGVQAPPLTPDSAGTLVISGSALADVTSVVIEPATGITTGAITAAPDGSRISVPLTLSGAQAGLRGVRVFRGGGLVPFIPADASTFRIGAGAPSIESITPIFANRGETLTLTIRGQNFQGVTAVTASPATGLFIDNTPAVNAAGTEVTVRIGIASDAPQGARLIYVITPGGVSIAFDPAANTFTVFP
ncbi:MAG: RHS repeat protein [Betaproteobacteria bacterium]|nr:RHS repeat protein [Betaproteobacteria bacterium]